MGDDDLDIESESGGHVQGVEAAEHRTGQQAGFGVERAVRLAQFHPVDQVADPRLLEIQPQSPITTESIERVLDALVP